MGILGILGTLGIFMDIWDFYVVLVEKCQSDFFRLVTDVSTEIRICQKKTILSANKADICHF